MTSSRDYGYMEDIIQFGNEVRQIAGLGREVYLGDRVLSATGYGTVLAEHRRSSHTLKWACQEWLSGHTVV